MVNVKFLSVGRLKAELVNLITKKFKYPKDFNQKLSLENACSKDCDDLSCRLELK